MLRFSIVHFSAETDVMSAMEGDHKPVTSTKDLTKRLQDLLVVAKKGKSLRSEKICEAVVREVDGLRSLLKPHPATGQRKYKKLYKKKIFVNKLLF